MTLPGYDAWKLRSDRDDDWWNEDPPEDEDEAPEPEYEHEDWLEARDRLLDPKDD